jgi:adenine phosphoribosyltransferase
VLLVDDVLATGGTAKAAAGLIRRVGGDLVGLSFLIELGFLNGRAKLPEEPVFSVLQY